MSRTERDTAMPPGSAIAWMRAARLTPSPKMFWSSSSTITSPRWTPMRNSMRWFSVIASLNCAMRSWISIDAATAPTAEPNSASMASPAVPTSRPLPAMMAGRQTSICADFRCRKVRVSAPSIMRVKPARSAWTMAARRRCMASPVYRSLAALESRLPLLTHRRQALLQVLGGPAFADAFADPGNVGFGLGELLDRPLHVRHRQWRQARQPVRHLVDPGLELGAVDQPVEIAHPQQVLVAEILRQEEGALGEARAHLLRIAAQAARIIVQAKARGRHEEAHAPDAQPKVAGQRHVGGAAIDAAVQGAERRHAHRLQPVHHRLEARIAFRRRGRLAARRLTAWKRAMIEARAEALLAGAGEHRDTHVGIGVGLLDGSTQPRQPGRIEAVVPGRIVERDRGARAVDGEQYGVGHDAPRIAEWVVKGDRARHSAGRRK